VEYFATDTSLFVCSLDGNYLNSPHALYVLHLFTYDIINFCLQQKIALSFDPDEDEEEENDEDSAEESASSKQSLKRPLGN
jgi:hypothetical protein